MALSTRNVQVFSESVNNTIDRVATNSYTVGSGTELLVISAMAMESGSLLTGANAGQIASITYGGVALTLGIRIGGAGAGLNDRMSEIWYLSDPTPGTANIVTTFDAQTDATAVIALEVIGGVDLIDPVGGTNTAESASAAGSVIVTTEGTSSLVLGFLCVRVGSGTDSDPFAPTSGSEILDGQTGSGANGDLSYWVASLAAPTAGNYTVSCNFTASNSWSFAAMEVKFSDVVIVEGNPFFVMFI